MAAAVPCPHLHLSGDSYSPRLMLLFHRILFPGSVCPTRLHFPTILVFRGGLCDEVLALGMPSQVMHITSKSRHWYCLHDWSYSTTFPADCHGGTLSMLPGWLGGTKVTELYCISLSYTSAISVTLAAKSSGPQQPDEVWPRQPESYQAVARKATRQKWGVRARRQRGSPVHFKTALSSRALPGSPLTLYLKQRAE